MEINQSFENFFNIAEKVTTRIITTNTCNLHCTFCDVGCDQPIKKSSSHIFRQSPFTLEEDSLEKFYDVVAGNEAIYQELTNDGEPAQLARSVLPTATKSDIYISGTLDMWIGEHLETVYPKLTIVENKGFLPLRNHKAAHPQMIEIAKMIAEDIAVRFPNETSRIINYFE